MQGCQEKQRKGKKIGRGLARREIVVAKNDGEFGESRHGMIGKFGEIRYGKIGRRMMRICGIHERQDRRSPSDEVNRMKFEKGGREGR